MNTPRKLVPLMTRLPDDLHAEVKALAQGDAVRQQTALNTMIVFLLRKGIECYRREMREQGFPLGEGAEQGQPALAI